MPISSRFLRKLGFVKKKGVTQPTVRLEAFAVDDGGAGLVILLLADPHLLEGGQRGQDGATDPHGVLALRGRDDLQRERGSEGLGVISPCTRNPSKVAALTTTTPICTPSSSGWALTLIFIVLGARAVISFCILSAMPGYMVVPPDSTVLA